MLIIIILLSNKTKYPIHTILLLPLPKQKLICNIFYNYIELNSLKQNESFLISIKQLHYIHSKIAFLENKVKCLESNAHKKDNNSYCGCNELYTLSTHHSNVNKKEISIPFQQRDNSCFNESIQEIDLTELKASNKTQLTEEDY